jgi:hypothetical protein
LRAEGLAGNILVKGLVHGVVGGALAAAQGGNFLQGFAANAVGAGTGLFSSQISGNDIALDTAIVGAAGGAASVLTGGKFAAGFITASFANLFNKFGAQQEMVGGAAVLTTGMAAYACAGGPCEAAAAFVVSNPVGWVVGGVIAVGVGGYLAYDYATQSESTEGQGEKSPPKLPDFDYNDPTKAPTNPDGTEWVWKGPDAPGGERGGWVNPDDTDQSLHPDLNHGGDVGPHWDLNDRQTPGWRIFPDGSIGPK